MPEGHVVGMAEMKVARAPDKLLVHGVGSCVVLVLWDPQAGLGGMAHSVLPSSAGAVDVGWQPAKYCDSAVGALLDAIEDGGGRSGRCRAWLVGGATMFAGLRAVGSATLGERNLASARACLSARGLPIMGEDCGGERGRSLEMDCVDGSVVVWSAWTPARRL